MYILPIKIKEHITTEEDLRTASSIRRTFRSVPACKTFYKEERGKKYVERICGTKAL
mgnify:CR=1 FL=1